MLYAFVSSIGYAVVYWRLKRLHGAISIVSGNAISETYLQAGLVSFSVTASIILALYTQKYGKTPQQLVLFTKFCIVLFAHLLLSISVLPDALGVYPIAFSAIVVAATVRDCRKLIPWLLQLTGLFSLTFLALILSPLVFLTPESSKSKVNYMEPIAWMWWPCLIVSLLLSLNSQQSKVFPSRKLKRCVYSAICLLWIVIFAIRFPTTNTTNNSTTGALDCISQLNVQSLLSGHAKCDELTTDVLNSQFTQEIIRELRPIVDNPTMSVANQFFAVAKWINEKEKPFYQHACSIYGTTVLPCAIENILAKASSQWDPSCNDQVKRSTGFRLAEIGPHILHLLGRFLCSERSDTVHCGHQFVQGYFPQGKGQLATAWTTVAQIPNDQSCLAFQGQKYQSTTDRTSLLTPLYV